MYTTPHNRNVNTNSKGLILDNMTWSATQFNVPMVTAGFLTALLKTMWQVWLYTCPHTHTHKSTLHLQKGRGGRGHRCFFLSSLESSILSKHVHTNKSTLTPPKEQTQQGLYGDVLILTHVKISAQSPLLPLMYYYSQHWSPHCAGARGWRGGAVALPSTGQTQNLGFRKGWWGSMRVLCQRGGGQEDITGVGELFISHDRVWDNCLYFFLRCSWSEPQDQDYTKLLTSFSFPLPHPPLYHFSLRTPTHTHFIISHSQHHLFF